MATRRRTSAVKSTTTVKKSPRTVVKKSTVTSKSVNKVTPIEEVKVTETPVKVKPEVSLISRDQYLQDVKNRWQIHQFETQQLWEDLVKGYNYVSPCILAGSEENDIVLDPFMGSGTTAMVARSLGRYYIGCELHEEYNNLIQERVPVNILSTISPT